MPKRDNHYAILVAINRYPGLSDLNGPENDALEFRKWLLDETFGNLDERCIEVVRSSDFPPATDPDEANPTETEFKKRLNRWLKPKGDWLERVGERLYLFFAGHGFTAGSISDPALFTAQAQWGDTAHIAGLRYASRIQNAGFFDEIVLVMDCCQDVLKAAHVGEPTWSPPDRQRSSKVKLMQAYGAPRGNKAFENPGGTGAVHGYFSGVFMDALRTASADSRGFVTARAVEDTFSDLWADRYLKLTGYEPPFVAPRDMVLYRRGVPTHIAPTGPESLVNATGAEPPVGGPASELGTQPLEPLGPRSVDYVNAAMELPIDFGSIRGALGRPDFGDVTLMSREPGVQISIIDSERHRVSEGVGRLQVKLPAGRYTARFRVGDEVQDRSLTLEPNGLVEIEQGLLAFSSPIPLEDTSTYHEYHYDAAMALGSRAAERAYQSGYPDSVGTLTVFARDSAHKEATEWRMPLEVRTGLRLRRIDEHTGAIHEVPCEVIADHARGFVSTLLNDLTPGTYLLGVRRRQRDTWFWQEIALAVAASWWRTEVYVDSIEDAWTGRRFDIESASVLIGPGKGSGSLRGSDARFTEVARLALAEGKLGVDDHLLHWVRDMGMPEPMLALYTAYALTLSPAPDVESVRKLCEHLTARWTHRSVDVKLLERWCSSREPKSSTSSAVELKPDEVPMIARGWDLARQLGSDALLGPGAQYIGMWRTSGSLFTQTLVPQEMDDRRLPSERSADSLPYRADGVIDLARVASKLLPLQPTHSPLQQALRRAMINAIDSDDLSEIYSSVESVAIASGLNSNVIRAALSELVALPSSDRDDGVVVPLASIDPEAEGSLDRVARGSAVLFFDRISRWMAELFPSISLQASYSDGKADEVVKAFPSAPNDPYKVQLVRDSVGRWFLRVFTKEVEAARLKLRLELEPEASEMQFIAVEPALFFAELRLSEGMAAALKSGQRPELRTMD
jgi:hypothetical protein